jgi:asparagine synthase (glutamine-hydrolysing)
VTRKKAGFPTPLRPLFQGAWGRQAEEALMNPTETSNGLFDLAFVRTMFRDHREGRNDYSMPLAQLLMFEYWARAADGYDRVEREAA